MADPIVDRIREDVKRRMRQGVDVDTAVQSAVDAYRFQSTSGAIKERNIAAGAVPGEKFPSFREPTPRETDRSGLVNLGGGLAEGLGNILSYPADVTMDAFTAGPARRFVKGALTGQHDQKMPMPLTDKLSETVSEGITKSRNAMGIDPAAITDVGDALFRGTGNAIGGVLDEPVLAAAGIRAAGKVQAQPQPVVKPVAAPVAEVVEPITRTFTLTPLAQDIKDILKHHFGNVEFIPPEAISQLGRTDPKEVERIAMAIRLGKQPKGNRAVDAVTRPERTKNWEAEHAGQVDDATGKYDAAAKVEPEPAIVPEVSQPLDQSTIDAAMRRSQELYPDPHPVETPRLPLEPQGKVSVTLDAPDVPAPLPPVRPDVIPKVAVKPDGPVMSAVKNLGNEVLGAVGRNSFVNRYVLPISDALKAQGKVGATVARKLLQTTEEADRAAAEPIAALQKIEDWAVDQKRQLALVLDGKLSAADVPTEVAKMAALLRNHLDRVSAAAAKHMGDKFSGHRDNYYPHYRTGEQPTERIFSTRETTKPGEHLGSLSNPRKTDGDYDTDAVRVLGDYFQRAWREVTEAKHFGTDVQAAINRFAKFGKDRGEDGQFIQTAMEAALGKGAYADRETGKWASRAMNTQVALKLPTAVIGNATQLANTFATAGFKNTAKALLQIPMLKNADDLANAIKSGATLESLVKKLSSGNLTDPTAIASHAVLKNTGFAFVEKWNRILSSQAFINRAEELAIKAQTDPHAIKQLEELGVNVREFRKTGKLSDTDLQTAGFRGSHKTQFGGRREDLPIGWTENSTMRVLTQFKGFGLKQAKFILADVMGPALRGDFAPLSRYAAAAGVTGYMMNAANDLISGRDPKDPTAIKSYVEGVVAVGMANIVGSIYRSGEHRGGTDFVLGPTGTTIGDTFNVAAGGISPKQFVNRTIPITKKIEKTGKKIAGAFDEEPIQVTKR